MGKQQWTPQEVSILKRLYAEASWPDMLKALPRWTQQQIITKAHQLTLHRINRSKIPWTPEEDKVLYDEFYTTPVKELKKKLGRPGISIYARARRLSMKRRADTERQDTSSVAEHHKRMIAKYFGKSVS